MQPSPQAMGAPSNGRDPVLWEVSARHDSLDVRTPSKLDLSKPCIFFLGGAAYMSKGRESVEPQYRATTQLLTGISPQQYNFYTVTLDGADEKKEGMVYTGIKNQAYNDDPLHYASSEAIHIVKHYLAPALPDLKGKTDGERERAIATIERQLGNVTLFNFSYGCVMAQELRNGLSVELAARGFTDKESARVTAAIGSVNVGPTFKYLNKPGDMSQITLVLSSDKGAVRASGIQPTNPDMDFTHPSGEVAVCRNGNHTAVHVRDASTRLRGINYPPHACTEHSIEQLVEMAQNWQQAECGDLPDHVVNKVVNPHNKQLQTASLRTELDDAGAFYVFPSNLVGINSGRFLNALVHGSLDAHRQHQTRNAAAILKGLVDEHLSSDGVAGDQAHIMFFRRIYEDIGGPAAAQGVVQA